MYSESSEGDIFECTVSIIHNTRFLHSHNFFRASKAMILSKINRFLWGVDSGFSDIFERIHNTRFLGLLNFFGASYTSMILSKIYLK